MRGSRVHVMVKSEKGDVYAWDDVYAWVDLC